jgi:hypothetical protein
MKTERIRRRGTIRKQLLDDLKKKRRYWNLKEARDRTSGEITLEGQSWDKLRNELMKNISTLFL